MKIACFLPTLFLIVISHYGYSQTVKLYPLPQEVKSSFRALSVVDDHTAWVAGSGGWVGATSDGGISWHFQQVPEFGKADFRSLYAFSSRKAIIVNAGSPASVLLTQDGGATWKTVYTNTDANVFADGIDFWNEQEGVIYGDPMDRHLFLLRTTDGGLNWKEIRGPELNTGEASFAASGTGIRCKRKSELIISTGGKTSRLFVSIDKGDSWKQLHPPATQEKESAGIFSVDRTGKTFIVVGGDFTNETGITNNAFISADNGKTWIAPRVAPRGYRECVEFITKNKVITTGPSGTEVSLNRGLDWHPIADEKGFHVVRKAWKGNLVVIAGKEKLGIVAAKIDAGIVRRLH
ncbi:MAG: hypothetical protein KIT62_14800 [Cyclobacteriaceae bacterium]|nr:hypothetical protein [Cyclobacteriaceae bacterium]